VDTWALSAGFHLVVSWIHVSGIVFQGSFDWTLNLRLTLVAIDTLIPRQLLQIIDTALTRTSNVCSLLTHFWVRWPICIFQITFQLRFCRCLTGQTRILWFSALCIILLLDFSFFSMGSIFWLVVCLR
jgi:hypothetical protein